MLVAELTNCAPAGMDNFILRDLWYCVKFFYPKIDVEFFNPIAKDIVSPAAQRFLLYLDVYLTYVSEEDRRYKTLFLSFGEFCVVVTEISA